MHKHPVLLLLLLLPILATAQEGFSFGIQSHYGVGRISVESTPRTVTVEPQQSITTGGSLFLQWNLTDRFGIRLQAEGLYQSMVIRIIDPANFQGGFAGGSVEDFVQGATNLQFSYNQPLNSTKTLRLEGFLGGGIRGGATGRNGCGTSISGAIGQNDTLGTVTVSASSTTGNGAQLEVMGGFRMVQQVNGPDKKPIFLTVGASYRQALSSLAQIEGITYSDQIEVTTNQFGQVQFPFAEIQEICQPGGFETRPEDSFFLQHFGQQIEMQIGVRFGL